MGNGRFGNEVNAWQVPVGTNVAAGPNGLAALEQLVAELYARVLTVVDPAARYTIGAAVVPTAGVAAVVATAGTAAVVATAGDAAVVATAGDAAVVAGAGAAAVVATAGDAAVVAGAGEAAVVATAGDAAVVPAGVTAAVVPAGVGAAVVPAAPPPVVPVTAETIATKSNDTNRRLNMISTQPLNDTRC